MTFSVSGSGDDLLCGEDSRVLLADDDSVEYPLLLADDSIAEFVEGESDYSPGLDYQARFRSRSLDAGAREDAVAWILKVHAYYRFCPLTAYLAVNYMDRFLSTHRLPQANGWPLQLLAVACLSLAAKMEETLVPSLLDLQIEVARFLFEPRTIFKMELLVLTALNWRLRSITPFTYIDRFAFKADPSRAYIRFLVSWATRIILATIHDVEFLHYCPSSVAAAAIICAAREAPDRVFIDSATAAGWCIGLTKEGISDCYQLMQETGINSRSACPPKILPQLRITQQPTAKMGSGSSSSSSPPPNKKRKLAE